MDFIARAKDVLDVEIEGLRKVRQDLGPGFNESVGLMLRALEAGRKIVVAGVGKNLHIAQKISATFASTGATSVVLVPSQAMHGDLGILTRGDVLLALSYSGESDELLNLLPLLKRLKVRVVALTGQPESTLGRLSDAVIAVTVDREACPFNMAPTASTTATLAVGDALAMVLLEARGVRREDYAKLHPGGAIGRSLLLRVSDIMRTGDRLVRMPRAARVKEALLAMTQARAGSAGVVDGDGGLLGVFTDGDLRRHLATETNLLELPIEAVMTSSPVTVFADQLAVEALSAFEEHSVDDLLVVDRGGRLVGAVDIQDLPKFKIF